MIQFLCANCGYSLKVPADKGGARMKCPHCGQPVCVPKASPPPLPSNLFAEMLCDSGGEPLPYPQLSRPRRDAPTKRLWLVAGGSLLILGPLLAAALLGRSDRHLPQPSAPARAKVGSPVPSEVAMKSESGKKEKLAKTMAPPAKPPASPPSKIKSTPNLVRSPAKEAPAPHVQTAPAERKEVVQAAAQEPPPDDTPYLDVRFNQDHRFGINLLKNGEAGPQHPQPLIAITGGRDGLRLTFSGDGTTNNTLIRLDGQDLVFGMGAGTGRPGPEHDTCKDPISYREGPVRGWRTYRDFPRQKVRVVQDVSIRRGSQSRKLDTCLVQYTLQNKDKRAHNVGIRFMLDTLIGGNDGVPFTIPGQSGLCTTWRMFDKADDVPDFIQALEKPDLRDPGTVAYLRLRFSANEGLERPSSLRLCHWHSEPGWLVRPWPIDQDSAAVIYWDAAPLAAGEERRVGFSYGLGTVAGGEGGGHLALSLGGTFVAKEDFFATAYINKPMPRETLTIQLPPGVTLADGERAEKSVVAEQSSSYAEVSWRVRAAREGVYTIKVKSSNGARQTQEARIARQSAGGR